MTRRSLLVVAVVAATACIDSSRPTRPGGPSYEISDAMHGTSRNPFFFFLPPMVPDPSAFFHTGAFNATANPVVNIRQLAVNGCTSRDIATFTMTTGPGTETVRLGDQQYIVNWQTDQFDLSDACTYRIRVLRAGAELGFADVDVLASAKGIRNVNTDEFVPLVDGRTLPIKFRIETSCATATRECNEQIVDPGVQTVVRLINEFGHVEAFADFPIGWTDAPAVVKIERLPDPTTPGSGPLGTSFRQWPIFAEYFTTAPAPFKRLVRIGVCEVEGSAEDEFHGFDRSVMRLAKGGTAGTFVVLPSVAVADILGSTCATVHVSAVERHDNGWRRLARLFTPSALYAATVAVFDGGSGGLTGSFSPVGAVEAPVGVPEPLIPLNGTRIVQNNPDIDCSFDANRGFGFQIQFDWADVTAKDGVAGYELFVKQQGADLPLINNQFVEGSEFTFLACNDFVTDGNLQGWEWRVRARDSEGRVGDYSPTQTFEFEPCRLSEGEVCNAPPPPPGPGD